MTRWAVALVVLTGCLSAAPVDDVQRAPDEGPAWRPNPPVGPQPALRPGSDFVPAPWGFVQGGFAAPPGTDVPVILTIDGYEGAGAPTHYVRARDGTLLAVHVSASERFADAWIARASLRGTGCSGGAFDLFDQVAAQDGRELVEWLAAEPWTLDRVGLYGISYGGITALLVAGTSPPSLGAVAAAVPVADVYRDVAAPGGIANRGFATAWTLALRPAADASGTRQGAQSHDEVCAFNVAHRPPGDPTQHPLGQIRAATDGPWFRHRSPIEYANGVRAPTLLSAALHDEQTGPRGGPEMMAALSPEAGRAAKRLELTNGWHRTGAAALEAQAPAWFDHWIRGLGAAPTPGVHLHLAATGQDTFTPAATVTLDAWPPTDATWVRLHLRAGGALAADPPGDEPPDTFVAGATPGWLHGQAAGQQNVRPDGVAEGTVATYETEPLTEPWLLAGPGAASLWLASTARDTDVFVAIEDVDPDGGVVRIQRGLLRASHRAVDPTMSWTDASGTLVRPYHPHTANHPLEAGAHELHVELLPMGHAVAPGHRVRVVVSGAPVADGLWAYDRGMGPAANTLHHDAARPSYVALPRLAWPADLAVPVADCHADGFC